MSLGQQAVILIRLDAQDGAAVAVDDLTTYLRMPADLVRQRIQELSDKGYAVPLLQAGTALIIGARAKAMPTELAAHGGVHPDTREGTNP